MIIDGKKVAQGILDDIKKQVAKLEIKPTIAVVVVGENSSSKIYVNIKNKKATEIGMNSVVVEMSEDTKQQELEAKIEELNQNPDINAILVQMPLPKHLDAYKIIEEILPEKDVDGFHPENVGRLSIGLTPFAYSCTPKGVIRLLDEYNIDLESKHVVVIGRSNIVGKPLSAMLLARNATVTMAHSKTKNLPLLSKSADILVSAVGSPKLVKREWLKDNAVVIDVGISRMPDGKIVGDVDFENVQDKASFITPVPGGVGPMTIAMLLENTLNLYYLQKEKK
ncbi:MAG: bifunctional 5,10-methylenetetrahydrofolate dehydrogenase/5,10-methenyltetrahydrofolate cyclohydrolase [bacterium]